MHHNHTFLTNDPTGSQCTINRYGAATEIKNGRRKRNMKNPYVVWNHDRGPWIGRNGAIWVPA